MSAEEESRKWEAMMRRILKKLLLTPERSSSLVSFLPSVPSFPDLPLPVCQDLFLIQYFSIKSMLLYRERDYVGFTHFHTLASSLPADDSCCLSSSRHPILICCYLYRSSRKKERILTRERKSKLEHFSVCYGQTDLFGAMIMIVMPRNKKMKVSYCSNK